MRLWREKSQDLFCGRCKLKSAKLETHKLFFSQLDRGASIARAGASHTGKYTRNRLAEGIQWIPGSMSQKDLS